MSIFSRLRLAETKPRPDTSERGDNAVSWSVGSGRDRSLRNPEYLYELSGRQGGRIYRRMRWSDPHIAGLRAAQNLPLLRASAKIEPADPKDKDALAKAELVKRLLLDDFPWRAFLSDTCLCLDYGFAAFEIVWRIENGEARFRLALRPASSIAAEDIYVRNGAVDHVIQRPETGGEFTIPGEKLVWFCHDKEGDVFTGRPILRAMYKPWKIKEELEVELPILIRKLGGVPDITTQDTPSETLATQLDQAGANFGVTGEMFFRHDADVTVQLLTGSAKVDDVLKTIQQENTEITGVCQAQVFDLGTSNSGSRALGTTLGDMFSDSVQAQANYREDVLNATGGLIHQVIANNFPTDDNRPKLRFGNVQRSDMRAMAQAMSLLGPAFKTLDEETQEWVRAELNMPAGTTTQVAMPGEAPKTEPAEPDVAEPDETGAQASEGGHVHGGLKLAERRPPRGVECYVALDELSARFDDAKTAIREATQATRGKLAAELVRRAQAAAAKGEVAQFAAGSPPMVDKLTAEVRTVLSDFYTAGRKQVADELARQRAGKPVVAEIVAERDGKPWTAKSIRAAERRKSRAEIKKMTPDERQAFLEKHVLNKGAAIQQQAEMTGRAIAQTTQNAAAAAAARIGSGVPLHTAAMAEAVIRESDAAALRMSAVVTDLMQAGRADEARDWKTEVKDAVYSAILDEALCSECEPWEGETTTDLDEAAGWTPNPSCEGGSLCRCLTIYEYAQEDAA